MLNAFLFFNTSKLGQRKQQTNKATPKKPDCTGHLSCDNYYKVVNWLSNEKNFDSCFGKSGQTHVGRPPLTAINGFQKMAEELSKKTKGKVKLTGKLMADRFRTYKKKYMEAKNMASSTGSGLTADNQEKGITSIDAKQERICPHFSLMDNLFSTQPNVNPPFQYDAQDSNEEDDELSVSKLFILFQKSL